MTACPIRFGTCELRLVTRELFRDGKPSEIQPRAFDLLVYLIENPDRVVGKDELLDRVWGQRVVSESVVARTVMKARKAIGDDAAEPHFILTQHGHGYRFVGELVDAGASPAGAVPIDLQASDSEWGSDTDDHVQDIRRVPPGFRAVGIVGLLGIAGVLLLALGIAALAPEQVRSGTPARTAVLPIVNATGEDSLEWTEYGLMGVLGKALTGMASVDVPSPGELRSALDAMAVAGKPILSEKDLEGIAERLAAEFMVQGRLRHAAEGFQLDIHVIGRDGGALVDTLIGPDPVDLALRAATRIADLQGIPKYKGAEFRADAPTAYIKQTYARAMDAMAHQRHAEAARLLQLVVNADGGALQPKVDLAKALLQARQTRQALAVASALEASALAASDHRIRAEAFLVKARAQGRLDYLDDAEASLRQALALASPDFPGIKADAELQLGILAYRQYRRKEAAGLMRAAMSGYLRLGSDYRLAGAHLQLGNVKRWRDVPEAARHYRQAYELAERSGWRLAQVLAVTGLADARRISGECPQAMARLEHALALAQELRDNGALARVHQARSRCEVELGRAGTALASMRTAIDLAESAGEPELLAPVLFDYAEALAGDLGVETGDVGRLRRAAESYGKNGHLTPAVGTLLNVTQQLVREADRYDDLALLQSSLEVLSHESGDSAVVAGAIVLRAMLAYRQDSPIEAAHALEQARVAAGIGTRLWVDSSATLLWLRLELRQETRAKAVAESLAVVAMESPALCVVRARLLYEEERFPEALEKQQACLAEFGASMNDVGLAYRDSYAAATRAGELVPLPEAAPRILWL